MSTVNRIALNVGHAPKAALKSAVVKSFIIGATSDVYSAAQESNAAASVTSTLTDLGFSAEEAASMLAGS